MQADYSKSPEAIEASQIVQRTADALQGLKVTTAAEYELAAGYLGRIKAGQKHIEGLRTKITVPLNTALKAVNDLFRGPSAKLVEYEGQVKRSMIAYQDEQERIRREEQRRADEKARQERSAAEARAAEARRKADEEAAALRRQAEEEAAAGRAAEAAKLAAKAEQKVERAEAKAEALELHAASVVAPVITREPPKVAGIAKRTVWLFEVTDPAKVNSAFTIPDEKKIRKLVNSLGADAAPLLGDGVRIWSEQQIAAGAA